MASCLRECLCEAELEQYYPHFLAVGLQKVEELATVTMKDYSRLGVHNMEDRKRLFQLIKIIQSVSEEDREERTPLQPGCVYLQPQTSRSATRRQLRFEVNDRDCDAFSSPEISYPQPKKCSAEPTVRAAPTEQSHGQKVLPLLEEEESSSCKAMQGLPPGSRDSEAPVIRRVMHVSGYNYGVPQPCMRPGSAEKEGPWTDTDKIRVCVRKRPLGLREERRGEMSVVNVEGPETVVIYERKEAVNLKEYILQHVFYFDEAFSEKLTNQDVYMKTSQPLIQHVFNGGNATCFAYGQTGAGKTYTMIGTQKNPGLYALAARDIFRLLESTQPSKDLSVWISFYEIYCGQLYDLLNGRKRLHAREDGKHVVQVVGLQEVQVHSVDFLLEMIAKGSRERSTGATGVNSDSSRSHAVIQIQIKDGRSRKLGRMSFIDLAGSERAADARESDKQTKMEGAEINQSLLALKECIRALDQEQAHTPFRQSKLTQVLKDSFIGNSKTCMIANVSPSHIATEHTLNTLRYADRVKELKRGIKNTPTCTNRSRSTPCVSPKRVQNTSSALGEKISPKKVKLGAQYSSTSVTAKTKSYPSVFHPNNVPLSSTPKISVRQNNAKGSPIQAWLAHTTPLKGAARLGHNGAKKCENQDKAPVQGNPQDAEYEVETDFKVHFNHHRQLVQRVQPVQPVQKHIVSKTAMPFWEYNLRPVHLGDKVHQKTSSEPSNRPEQKDREEHLRHYHQQFQNPPIFQQKLQYRPLEKILDLYKPQEVLVGHINTSLSHHEGLPLEDPDDSDFSEDSFSYVSVQKKGKKEELVRERLSFFLHQGSPDIRKAAGKGQGLSFSDSESPEHKQGVSCDCAGSCGILERTQPCGHQNLWSSGEDPGSACDSSNISNAPEKPYSSQEEPPKQPKKKKSERSSKSSPHTDTSTDLIAEQELHNASSPQIGSRAGGAMLSRDSSREAANNSSDSSAMMAPLTVSLLQDNWSVESTQYLRPHSSPKSKVASKDGSFEKDSTLESQIDEHSIEKNLSALVKKMLRYNESLQLQNSQNDWFLEASDGCNLPSSTDSPSFMAQQGSCDRTSPKLANVGQSPKKIDFSDSSLDTANSRSKDLIPPCYDADAEETAASHQRYLASPGVSDRSNSDTQNDQKEILCPEPSELLIPTSKTQSGCASGSHKRQQELSFEDTGLSSLEDSFGGPFKDSGLEKLKNKLVKCILAQQGNKEEERSLRNERNSKNKTTSCGQLVLSPTTSQSIRDFEKSQQLLLQAHCKQIKEVSSLCCQEEALLSCVSTSDFLDYVKKLEEILLQKSKHIENLRAQLQAFLDLPPTEPSSPLDLHEQDEAERLGVS
ncbi:PREDICTED: kinesin-like protein KIF24 [Nanorana parkeri]|uniref:kinesin-like protein KIF24 n=1 Tax=Nanorana parkeri TaxID=125878 RepID=UPI000854B12F|nr:PREDICTED: kinesin-like protein KIF24 [Nanorana parkeri]